MGVRVARGGKGRTGINELIAFRILRSRYSRNAGGGRIEDVVLRDVHIEESAFNPGYSVSHIGGRDEAHGVDGVRFEGCTYGAGPLRSLDDFDCYTKYARGIVFAVDSPEEAASGR